MCNFFRGFQVVKFVKTQDGRTPHTLLLLLFMSDISDTFLCSMSAQIKVILLYVLQLLMLIVMAGLVTGISFPDGPNRAGVSQPSPEDEKNTPGP
jgi:hypothetical protein